MQKRPLNVVVVDDDPGSCSFLATVLSAEGHECHTYLRPAEAEAFVSSNPVDLAIVDVYLGTINGIDLLSRFRDIRPELYAVVITAHVSLEMAAKSATEGAIDYVQKPLTVDQVVQIAERARLHLNRPKALPATALPGPQSAIIGRSPRMLEVYNAIARVAPSNANVLITGASGTGKELVARAIHQYSKRANQPFTPVNCGSLAETVLESELFGHERGAFTGADVTRKGLIEATEGGTLFLDEISETSLGFQVKLLRVIQEQQVRRIGSNKYLPIDVRILAATNRNMSSLIQQGSFREDLYYRLSVVQIEVPSLHDRREDIPLLIVHFLQQFKTKNDRDVTIEPDAIEFLKSQPWRGNVRELENTIHRLAIFAPHGRISRQDIELEMRKRTAETPAETAVAGPNRLIDVERQTILRVLGEAKGNRSEAARRLGIERKTLYKKALRLGINLSIKEEQ